MSDISTSYALCIENSGNADLVKGKVYPVLSDDEAAREGFTRVIDDSGEDYLYPATSFVPVDLPEPAKAALRNTQ